MSLYWKPPVYGVEGREVQWLNNTVQSHDIFCGCDDPFMHLVFAFAKRSTRFGISKNSLQQMQKCLTTSEEKGTQTDGSTDSEEETGGPEGDLNFGDLEKLFEQDGELTEEPTR